VREWQGGPHDPAPPPCPTRPVSTDHADEAMAGMARVQAALRALAAGDESRAHDSLVGPPEETSWAAVTLLGIVQDLFRALSGHDEAAARTQLAGLADSMDGDMAATGASLVLRKALEDEQTG
jgi:hypothetical protein